MEKYKLGDFCTIGSSKRIHLSDYVENGVPFYRSKEIIELSENKTLSETLFISQEKYDEIKAKFPVPKIDDILITSVGTLGKVYQVKDDFFYFKDGNLTWLRDYDESIIDVQYLYHWLRSSTFQTQISNNNIGAVQKALTIDYLKSVDIVLPRLETQQKIAKILSTLDRKIALNNQINAELEKMAKTLYDYWFVQFDFPDENGKPYKSSGGKMVWNEVLKREVPLGWEDSTIGKIENNIVTGKTPSKDIPENFGGNIPFITIGDIRDNTFIVKTEEKLTALGANSQKNKFLPENAICVTCIATVGLVGFTTQVSQTNQQINSIVCEDENNRFYLYFSLLDFFSVSGAKIGNTFANMNKNDFSNIKILKPRDDVLKQYFNLVNSLFENIKNNTKQNQTLTQYRDFLLPMLMNGQVEIL